MKLYTVTPDAPQFNAILYGDPGAGKTTLLASAQDCPEMADVLLGNVEGGTLSIAHRGDIVAIDLKKTSDAFDVFWKLVRREKEFKRFRTFGLDSSTELQTVNLEEIVADAIQRGKTASRSGKVRTIDDIWQEDYGKSTVQLKRLFRGLRDMRRHVIITALAKQVYPKVSEGTDMSKVDPIAVTPSLTAKLMTSVMGYMDFVWYVYFDQADKKHKVLTRTSGAYVAKTRGPRFAKAVGPIIVNPKMSEIYRTFVQSETARLRRRQAAV
jgi:hypothetical protein